MSLFHKFVSDINKIVKRQNLVDKRTQEELLNDLFELENKFKNILISSAAGETIYSDFIVFIRTVKKNILSSRIFFRERQNTFTQEMSQCFKVPDPLRLQDYRINYEFIKWACKNYKGPKKRQLLRIKQKVEDIRSILMHKDVFLALSRAKIFSTRAPNWRLEHMDMVQDACEGYLVAVDKFVPPYTTVFRSVAIGRMTLLMLTDHNATMVKFSPTEQRILYRAKNAKYKAGLSNPDAILDYVKESYPNTTPEQLARIEAASGVASLDAQSVDDSGASGSSFIDYMADDTVDIFDDVAIDESSIKLALAFSGLSLIEQKVLKLKFGLTRDEALCQILLKK